MENLKLTDNLPDLPKTLTPDGEDSNLSESAANVFRPTATTAEEIKKTREDYQKVTLSALTICCTCD